MARDVHRPHGHPEILPETRGFQAAAALSADRGFVVHFVPGGGAWRRRYRGRVEHLASGRSTSFSSLARLLAFVDATLDRPRPALTTSAASADRRRERNP